MRRRHFSLWLFLPFAWTMWFPGSSIVAAAGRVELIVACERGGTLTASQDWARALGQAGVENVRIRSRQPDEKPSIAVEGTTDRPTYVVTGVLNASDELIVPGERFTRGQAARLAHWLDELAAKGPPKQREKTAAFGLTSRQFEYVHRDLTQPVDFTTYGVSQRHVVEQIGRRLTVPLSVDHETLQLLGDEKLPMELEGLSCGTVLAYTLRPMSLCLLPRARGAQPEEVECVVAASKPGIEAWPVGWPPEKPRQEVLPVLFEFLNANIKGVPISRVLETVAERLKVPILLDHLALAHWRIDPKRIQATLPQKRTTYSILLQSVLFQARLQSELRVDEAGKPFLWVTSIKPL